MPSICATCMHGNIAAGDAESHFECGYFDRPPQFEVRTCNRYEVRGTASLHEMKAVAWMLRTDRKTNGIGFVPPKRRWEDVEE